MRAPPIQPDVKGASRSVQGASRCVHVKRLLYFYTIEFARTHWFVSIFFPPPTHAPFLLLSPLLLIFTATGFRSSLPAGLKNQPSFIVCFFFLSVCASFSFSPRLACLSLSCKWFSESGKLVQRLFEHILELADDEDSLVCVLVDEVSMCANEKKEKRRGRRRM